MQETKITATSAIADLDVAVSNPPAWLSEALAIPREEGFVEADGCDIHYFRWGDKAKPGILLLHGFLAHSRCFAFIAPYLAADYHVVAYDMSGMGDSGKRDSYAQEVRVAELLSVAEQTGLFDEGKTPTLIAHSYGGQVAVAAVHAHPEKFAGTVICDLMIIRPSQIEANAALFSPPGSQNPNRPNRIYPDYPTAKKRFVLSPPQAVEQDILFDFMAYHSLRQVDGGWSWKFDPSVFQRQPGFEKKWSGTGERVATAPGRKAIIYGMESVLFTADSVAYMKELAGQLGEPDIPIIGIPHARHHLMLDQPMAFVSSLKCVLEMWK